MATQVDFILNPLITVPDPATGPAVFSTTSDQTLAVITTAGAVSDLVTARELKVRDIIFVNYDIDGTPGQAVLTVTATSGGSLVGYTIPAGYLQAANNLSDVASAATALTNLGGQASNNIIAQQSASWGGGSASHAFTLTGITASSIVVGVITTSTNAVSICKIVPTTNTATVTFSADPGAATVLYFIALTVAQ